MQPTLGDVHVDALLTNFSNMFMQDEAGFVAKRVFPIIPVVHKSDRYLTFGRADFNRNSMRKRGLSEESAGGGYKTDNTPTYTADVYALHKDIDDQIRANADAIMQSDENATRYLTTQALINREIDWASSFFAASKWTTDWAGVASGSPTSTQVLQWNDPASTPIQDVRRMKTAIQIASTMRPNKGVMGRQTFDQLLDHPDVIDRIKYGQTPGKPALANLQIIAEMFELDEVMVMDGIQNAGVDVPGTLNGGESNAFIGGKNFLLVYTPSAPAIDTPASGYTFAWSGLFGAVNGTRIKSFYQDAKASTRIEIEDAFVHKLVSPELGGFVLNVVA